VLWGPQDPSKLSVRLRPHNLRGASSWLARWACEGRGEGQLRWLPEKHMGQPLTELKFALLWSLSAAVSLTTYTLRWGDQWVRHHANSFQERVRPCMSHSSLCRVASAWTPWYFKSILWSATYSTSPSPNLPISYPLAVCHHMPMATCCAHAPVTQKACLPVTQKACLPVTQKACLPVTQKACLPVTQKACLPVTQKACLPVTQKACLPVTQKACPSHPLLCPGHSSMTTWGNATPPPRQCHFMIMLWQLPSDLDRHTSCTSCPTKLTAAHVTIATPSASAPIHHAMHIKNENWTVYSWHQILTKVFSVPAGPQAQCSRSACWCA